MAEDDRQDTTERGFGRPLGSPREWLAGGPILDLPSALGETDAAVYPPFAQCLAADAASRYRSVHLRFSERMGQFETRMAELSTLLEEGTELVLDLAHVMAPQRVRASLQGQLSSFDHRPAPPDREVAFAIPRVVEALSRTGFVVQDLVELSLWDRQVPQASIEAMLKVGIAATRYLFRVPGDRLWVRAKKMPASSGSVLIATHGCAPDAVERTHAALSRYLPSTWQLCEDREHAHECRSWNELVTKSCGDRVWLLRGGDEPDEELFRTLRRETAFGPCVVSDAADENVYGLGLAMIPRAQLFDIGPLPDSILSELIAGEEYFMRASACGHACRSVRLTRGTRASLPAPGADAETHAKAFFKRWDAVADLENPGDPEALDVEPGPWEREGREPTISLCMIAKNEEQFLGACIERVKSVVDQIIVVDTGSSDRTIEIARAHGAEIYETTWEEDFSPPRNLSLEKATGDWILVLDADELVSEESLPELRRIAHDRYASGFHIRFRNEHENGKTPGVTMVRMFRNLPGVRYEYAIHEQVIPTLARASRDRNLALHPSNIEVLHFGYSDEMMEDRGKRERNLRLFEKQLASDPDDIYCLYKYADFCRIIGERQEDVRTGFERALDLLRQRSPATYREAPFAGEICALLALEHAKNGRLKEADAIVREGLQRFLPTPNLHYMAASIASSLGRHDEALSHYTECLAYEGKTLAVPIQDGLTGYTSFTGMANCWLAKGDLGRARELLEIAIDEKPDWEVSRLVLCSLHLTEGRIQDALEVLVDFLETEKESVPIRQQGALLLGELGLWGESLRWLDAAMQLGPEDPMALLREAGKAALFLGDVEGARSTWASLEGDAVASACLAFVDRIEGRIAPCAASSEEATWTWQRLRIACQKAGKAQWVSILDELIAGQGDIGASVLPRTDDERVPLGDPKGYAEVPR